MKTTDIGDVMDEWFKSLYFPEQFVAYVMLIGLFVFLMYLAVVP